MAAGMRGDMRGTQPGRRRRKSVPLTAGRMRGGGRTAALVLGIRRARASGALPVESWLAWNASVLRRLFSA